VVFFHLTQKISNHAKAAQGCCWSWTSSSLKERLDAARDIRSSRRFVGFQELNHGELLVWEGTVQVRTHSDVARNTNAYQSERLGVSREIIYRGSSTVPYVSRFCETVRKGRSGQRANDHRKIVLDWRQCKSPRFGGKHARRYFDRMIPL
jgi:hypothetical protein